MANFKEIKTTELQGNPFQMIGKDWMLVTAKHGDKVNTMTASWGGVGVLWGADVVYLFIRKTRYTKEFIDKRGKKEVIEDGCIEEEEDENKVEVGDDYIINFDENTDMKNEKELKIKKRKNRYNNV